jgi:hypothetical protein
MALTGSSNGEGKATARSKMPTLVINQCLSLYRDYINEYISENISGWIWMYNVCGISDNMALDLVYDIICPHPVASRHFSQFQLRWPHQTSSSIPFREGCAAFRSYMGRKFFKTHHRMKYWRWGNPHAFEHQVNRSNQKTSSSGMVKPTGEHFSGYSSDDLRHMIELPTCWQYKPGDILAIRSLNWDEIINDNDDEKC